MVPAEIQGNAFPQIIVTKYITHYMNLLYNQEVFLYRHERSLLIKKIPAGAGIIFIIIVRITSV